MTDVITKKAVEIFKDPSNKYGYYQEPDLKPCDKMNSREMKSRCETAAYLKANGFDSEAKDFTKTMIDNQ